MHQKTYHYAYQQDDKKCFGTSCHENDIDAVSYYRSLENNGRIRMKSLKINGYEIWEVQNSRKIYTNYGAK